jgi:glycosyltransferase involved in cell wall biosynthesis
MVDLKSLRTLYLCYFGIRQPLVQTQVLPYLRELAKADISVSLLTFEPNFSEAWTAETLSAQKAELEAEGIYWFQLPYHKSPSLPATIYDIVAGARFAVALARREGINVLHARAHVPMAMALLARRVAHFKLIFDIRGLMAEEYADAGIWKENSLPFRLVKRLERAGIRRADQLVVLTQRLRHWLISQQLKRSEQIQVIPCCVDPERFKEAPSRVGDTDRFEVIYAGSLIGLYLVDEMGRFFNAVKALEPTAFLRILSMTPADSGAAALMRAGVSTADFKITAATPEEVASYLKRARLGVSFRKSTFAQIAASPTKIPEYLAAGLPVVCNAGVGDTDELVERERLGVVLRTFDEPAFTAAAREAVALAYDNDVRGRAQQIAHQLFDLVTVGGRRYVEVYQRLAKTDSGTLRLPSMGAPNNL